MVCVYVIGWLVFTFAFVLLCMHSIPDMNVDDDNHFDKFCSHHCVYKTYIASSNLFIFIYIHLDEIELSIDRNYDYTYIYKKKKKEEEQIPNRLMYVVDVCACALCTLYIVHPFNIILCLCF